MFIYQNNKLCYNNKGYVALISVLLIGAVSVSIVVTVILLGLGSSRSSFALEQSNQAKGLVNACVEEAMEQIRNSTSFTGSNNLTFGQGSCTYTVTSQGGENRTVTALATVGTIQRQAEVSLNQINPALRVVAWQEVVD